MIVTWYIIEKYGIITLRRGNCDLIDGNLEGHGNMKSKISVNDLMNTFKRKI